MTDAAVFRLVGILCAAAGVLCFSLRPALIKLVYVEWQDPVGLLTLRMALSLPFFAAMAWWAERRAATPLRRTDFAQIIALGFVGYYLSSFLDFLGLQYVSAGLGRLVLFLYPTLVAVGAALFLRRPITRSDLLALALTYAGVAVVVGQAVQTEGDQVLLGAVLIFGSALGYAAYLLGGGEVVRRIGSLRFTAWATMAAAMFALLQFLLLKPVASLATLSPFVWSLAGVIATLCTVVPIFLTAEGLRRAGAKAVAVVGGLAPVSAYALGFVLLGEPFDPVQLVGAALVIAGVLTVTLQKAA